MKKLILSSEQVRMTILSFLLTLIFTSFCYSQTVTTDKDDYAPGEYVVITGSGWQAGEKVTFTFEETPKPETCVNSHDFFTYANSSGEIYYDEFLIKENHLGVSFLLTAMGELSGVTTAKFTDALNTDLFVYGASGTAGETITLKARLVQNQNGPGGSTGVGNGNGIPNLTISFSLNGTIVGSSITDNTGNATLNTSIPASINSGIYPNGISGSYIKPQQVNYNASNGTAALEVLPSCTVPTSLVAPVDNIISYGENVQFLAGGAGNDLKYQWQVNTGSGFSNLTDNTIYSGVSSATLNIAKPPVSYSSYQYRAKISNDCGEVFSNPATLTINKRDITGSFSSADKTFDGTTEATITGRTLSGTIEGDDVSLIGGLANFSDINAGNGKTVTLNNAYLAGADALNYNLVSVNNSPASILKAPSITTVTIEGGPFIYTGSAIEPAKVSVTGAGGLNLAPTPLYGNNTNSGTATASYNYGGDINHEPSSDSKTFAINKATATIIVNGYDGVYDGNPHGAALVSAVGVQNEDLSASVTIDPIQYTNAPGGAVGWSFENANYIMQSGSVDINIAKAFANIIISGYEGIYDGNAHGATGKVLGVKNEELSGLDLGASFTNVPGGTGNWIFTDQTGNYNDASGTVDVVITKADAVVSVSGHNGVYDGNAHGASGSAIGVKSEPLIGLDLGASFTNFPGGTAEWSFMDQTGNYNNASGNVEIKITKALLSVTAGNTSKYCGQANPSFAFSYSGFVNNEDETVLDTKPVATSVATTESTDFSYPIIVSGGSDNNYDFSYINGELTINSISIDASSSSSPVQLGTVAILKAQVNPAVSGVSVSFYVNDILQGKTQTDSQGIASFSVANLAADVYVVKAIAGAGCDQSEAYLPVYDPNGGFVTGGGWIESPTSAMSSGITGKANFGFNAKYKSGKNNTTEVDGNTSFQFKAGDLNFSSTKHAAMSLVISGAKATYTGEGTINGTGEFEFRLIAIDGELLGNSSDKFRIKIWQKGIPANVVYDNKRGVSESADDASELGGGSIVIHKPKGNKEADNFSKPVTSTITTPVVLDVINNLEIAPNPVYEYAEIKVSLLQDSNVVIKIFDLNGRLVRDLYNGKILAGTDKVIGFDKQNLMSGFYICKVYSDSGQTMEKQLMIK